MRMWLSKQYDNRYMLTKRRPVKRILEGTQTVVLAPWQDGEECDQVGFDKMCIAVTEQLCPMAMLAPLQSKPVDVQITLLDE